jgi:hypothetical protein
MVILTVLVVLVFLKIQWLPLCYLLRLCRLVAAEIQLHGLGFFDQISFHFLIKGNAATLFCWVSSVLLPSPSFVGAPI